MRQILLFALFGFVACGVYTPPRRYQSTNQYSRPSTQYGTPVAQPLVSSQQVPILRLDNNNNGDGTYSYAYETANGIVGQEQGDARGDGTKALGGYAYTSPNGQPIQLQYTADENGFIPQGSHLPVGLEGSIRKSVEKNLAEERRGVVNDGQYRAGSKQNYAQQQQYSTTQRYTAPPKYNAPQKYQTSQKYTPTRFNTQQYRAPQPTSNKYLPPAFPKRPQTGYKF